MDADIFGPSVPKMFQVEDARPYAEEVGGRDLIVPVEKYGIKLLSIGFFVDKDSAVLWRGAMASNALKQLIGDANWGELDYSLMRKHKPDIVIALIALGLILAGTIVIFAVGPRVAETKGAPSNTYILHHLPMVAGAIFMMIFMALDWQNLVAKLSRKFLKRTIVIPRNEVILEKYALKLLTIAAIMTAATSSLPWPTRNRRRFPS